MKYKVVKNTVDVRSEYIVYKNVQGAFGIHSDKMLKTFRRLDLADQYIKNRVKSDNNREIILVIVAITLLVLAGVSILSVV